MSKWVDVCWINCDFPSNQIGTGEVLRTDQMNSVIFCLVVAYAWGTRQEIGLWIVLVDRLHLVYLLFVTCSWYIHVSC